LNDDYTLEGSNYAAYVTFSSKTGKLLYKAGLRAQENIIAYNSHKIGKENSKTYFGLYPTVSLTYLVNQNQGTSLNLSYRRSMNDIPYSAISPVVTYNNEYSYTIGNLNLKPANYNTIQIAISIKNKWNIGYTFFIGEGAVRDRIFIDKDNPLVTYTMPVNEGKVSFNGLNVSNTLKVTQWWDAKISGSISRSYNKINYDDWIEDQRIWRYYFNLNNNFRFSNDWGGSLSFYDEPTFKDEDRTYKAVYGVGSRVYKYLLNKRLLININLSLYTKNRTLEREREFYWSSRANVTHSAPRFTVGVTYNFEHGKKVYVKRSQSIQQYQEYKGD
jgi:hypothetical protein